MKANTGRALWGKGAYVWDAMGNMLSYELGKIEPGPPDNRSTVPRGRTGSFEYVGTTPLLASVTTNDVPRSVQYDDAGNETSFFATRTYSARNFMEQVTDLAEPEDPFRHTLTYSYDGRGIRSIRAESPSDGPGSVARRYSLYSPELCLLAATRDDSPNARSLFDFDTFDKGVSTEIVWFADRPVAQVTPGGPTLFTFTDHLGTPILQTDSTATITAGKWQQVAGSLMPSNPYPKITCNPADCTGSQPRYLPASRSIPMCKWFFAYPEPAGAQSMLHEFLHDAGVGDGTPAQTSILTACFPGFAP